MSPLGGLKENYRFISFVNLVYIAWRNISSKKLRSGLTIMGIVIGIAAIFFLLSFGIGLQELVTKEILGNQSVRSIDIDTPNSKILKLNADSADRIRGLAHVNELSSTFSFPGAMRYNGSEIEGIVYGIDVYYQDLSTLNLVRGRLLDKNDVNNVLINRSALKAMGVVDEATIIGKTIQFNIPLTNTGATQDKINKDFTVVGVIDSGTGTEVFLPKFNFEAVGVSTYSSIKILVDDTENVSVVRRQIESLGFETASPLDTINQVNQIFRFFNILLIGIGMVGMIIAILGMFNTLTISLLERTKEIGLMIALGARPKDMYRLFMIEATLLSTIGAIVGIVLAIVAGAVINFFVFQLAQGRGVTQPFNLFATPPWLVAGTLIFMILVGLLVVYFPARRAQRINPIDALRQG
jgi:ABC-type antimicrobial peptide transport system permease subunit